MTAFFNITIIAELTTFVASLYLLDKKTTVWRLFIPWLFLVLLTETAGWYIANILRIRSNALLYNILLLISSAFFLWFLNRKVVPEKIKKAFSLIIVSFILFGIINLFFFQGFHKYNSLSETAGDIILSVLCCYFLFSLVKNPEHTSLLQMDYFWLANGLLFYSLGNALLYQFSGLLNSYRIETGVNIGNYINYSVNLVLHICLIIAFVCRRKATR